MLSAAEVPTQEEGVIVGATVDDVFTSFSEALGKHRVWSRDAKASAMPA
ncbi:hypothetical protein [Litchfieldella rifensis]|uniref:Catalase n=1 Tax=Litchfieldella rifensis TaxID=762643 RepID=A0ABV7LJR0_9GAMM